MKGLGTDKLLPDGKKREGALDATQDAAGTPTKKSGEGHGFESPVISEAGDSEGRKSAEKAKEKEREKEKEKEKEKKEEVKKPFNMEEVDKQAENDANYKRKVMEEVATMARKMSKEEIEEEKKVDKKNDKTKKPDRAFPPILKQKSPAKSPEKSRSDSRKKKKSKIRDEINGTRRPEGREYTAREDENNSHERHKSGRRARTPEGQGHKDDRKQRVDANDELILDMLRENRDKEGRSGRHLRAPAFDELEHPRHRRKDSHSHKLVRGGRGGEQDRHPSPVKSARSLKERSCPKKISDPRNDKTAPPGSAQLHASSSEARSYMSSRRRSQVIIIILALCLFLSLVVIAIQAVFITSKCGLH